MRLIRIPGVVALQPHGSLEDIVLVFDANGGRDQVQVNDLALEIVSEGDLVLGMRDERITQVGTGVRGKGGLTGHADADGGLFVGNGVVGYDA